MADRFDLINFGKSVVTTLGGITANVNIDANTLFVDGTNNRVGIGNTTPAHALSIAGALRTTALSTNYAVSDAVASTVATTTPTSVCSVTLTTLGKPVLLFAAGDSNPNQAGGWHYYQFYRDNTAIGKRYINENSGGASTNDPWATTFIDAPAAGTYSYQLRVWQGSGSFTYGEDGNVQAPTIIAMELI